MNAVRHHLKELESEGLVEYERKHRGVGAPAFAYRLSATGEALFPRRYEEALNALLDQVVETQGRGAAVELLEAYFAGLARRIKGEVGDVSPADRLTVVGRVLSEAGYMAEVSVSAGEGRVSRYVTGAYGNVKGLGPLIPGLSRVSSGDRMVTSAYSCI